MHPIFNSAICLLIKDENDYINEWLEWHIGIGVEHFYIYDNGSKTPISNSVNESYKPSCTFIDFSGEYDNTQLDCYADACRRFCHDTKWMAFIDTDEFIRPVHGENINDALAEFESYDGLYLRWVMYDANGHMRKDGRPQRERFTRVADYKPTKPNGKSIIQPLRIHTMGTHFPDGRPNDFLIVDSNGKRMRSPLSEFSANDRIVIDHYFTRSYEEWIEKAKRGSCDPRCDRKYDEFFLYNPDLKNIA